MIKGFLIMTNKISSKLDVIAESLESLGCVREARELDRISNTIDGMTRDAVGLASSFEKDTAFMKVLDTAAQKIKQFLTKPPAQRWVKVHAIAPDLAYLISTYPNPHMDKNTHPNAARLSYGHDRLNRGGVTGPFIATTAEEQTKKKFATDYLNKKLGSDLISVEETGLFLNIPSAPKPKKVAPLSPGYTEEELVFT